MLGATSLGDEQHRTSGGPSCCRTPKVHLDPQNPLAAERIDASDFERLEPETKQ